MAFPWSSATISKIQHFNSTDNNRRHKATKRHKKAISFSRYSCLSAFTELRAFFLPPLGR